MKSSYLVQRLKKPYGKSNPFSFGGGLRNGGLSDEAMGLLNDIFSFDYMGAAEFEFGAIPEALLQIAKNAENYYLATSFTLPLNKVAKGWRDKATEDPIGNVEIFIICKRSDVDEVQARIEGWAKEPYVNSLKEKTLLSNTLRPDSNWETGVKGWLELDNGFFFFLDEEMWKNTAKLFGIETW